MEDLTGPVPTSNWIIKDKLLASSYPAKRAKSPRTIQRWMDKLIEKANISLFVSLMEPKDRVGLFPYEPYLVETKLDYTQPGYQETIYSQRYQRDLTFVNFPIVDKNVLSDEDLLRVVDEIKIFLDQGHRILIHCYGGKGRTGTVMATLLCRHYGFEPQQALIHIYGSFIHREKRSPARMTLTSIQEAQVRRIMDPETRKY